MVVQSCESKVVCYVESHVTNNVASGMLDDEQHEAHN